MGQFTSRCHAIAFAAAIMASPVAAQTVMDQSKSSVSTTELEKISDELRKQLTDPFSSQIIKLIRPNADNVCGWVNYKNGLGAYQGFRPFLFELHSSKLMVYPTVPRMPNLESLSASELKNLSDDVKNVERVMATIGKVCPTS